MSTTPPANPLAAMAADLTPKRAISYIRVSTKGQAARGDAAEGFSIPAQREANKNKAAALGAFIVKEFIDRGESARNAKRPELQKMLAYITEHNDIDYVIVHKLDRLARNRADDVDINRVLEQHNVRLVSTSENIDQTPGGMLLHGIMSSIAEFYSRNLAAEVSKGMSEKVKHGGTIGKAPLGYVNKQGKNEHGKRHSWVEVDPVRGPLIAEAFREYATDTWTAKHLTEHLSARGLTQPATSRYPERPMTQSRLIDLLHNPYYRGVVSYQGVEYPGRHQALVDDETWHKVQTVLSAHYNGERRRVHHHHLKTTVRCGQCGSRLIIQNTKNKRGVVYPYFVCSYRQRQRDGCRFKAVLIDEVEAKVAELYRTIRITPAQRKRIAAHAECELERIYASRAEHVRQLEQQSRSLLRKRQKLLDAHYADAIALDLLKQEQDQIAAQLASIDQQRAALSLKSHTVQTHLGYVLDLLEDCFRLYMQATPSLKKLLNGVFFTAVAINPQDDASGVSRTATAHLQPVISVLRQFDGEVDDGGKQNTTWASTASGVHDNACLSKGIVVRLGRLELPRPKALEPKSSASANSATGASGGYLTVACGFVKVPARAQLTPTTSQARYADTQDTDLPLNKITPLR